MKFVCFFAALVVVATAALAANAPRVFLLSPTHLTAARERLTRGDPALQPALAALREDADRALWMKPVSVMDKTRTPPSGDKHDYLSQAPYWWPDPSKPNGLPYIRRDGEHNPEIDRGTDHGPMGRMMGAVETLALAYWFTSHEPYAEHAAKLVRVWFLDPATRMNPHLNFAQGIPGINTGRGIGIIETNGLGRLSDNLALLAGSAAWSDADAHGMHDWLAAYFAWLTTSANGLDEAAAENNHGSWYDAQAAHLALYLGQDDLAKKILTTGLQKRLTRQIEPDGRQPLELARTKSLGYSLFNLEALFACATLGERVGVDWWNYATPDGRSLRAALAYLAPYADPGKKWPHQQITAESGARIVPLLVRFVQHRDDAEFRALLAKFGDTPEQRAAGWQLLYAALP